MFLIFQRSGDLIRVDDVIELMNPLSNYIWGRSQAGEEEQEFTMYAKSELMFPSGEALPRCWLDVNYHSPTRQGVVLEQGQHID
jgi:hypothetical protein